MIIAALYTTGYAIRGLLVSLFWIGLALGCGLAVHELRSSEWQAHYLSKKAKNLTFKVGDGPNPSIRFPTTGPFDERFGYANLASLSKNLVARDFDIVKQAQMSPDLLTLVDRSIYPPYREKTQTGLQIFDCGNSPLFSARYPERTYGNFSAIPKLLVDSLLFIENRELLDTTYPNRNPAVEWDRFGKALIDQGISVLFPAHDTQGGSTLADRKSVV